MSDWALDPVTGDLAIAKGRVWLVDGNDAIAQDWSLRMSRILGEWFRDQRKGVDLDVMLDKLTRSRQIQIRAIVRAETLAVRGLVSVLGIALDLNRSTRVLTVTVQALKDSGEVVPLATTLGLELSEAV